jgi:hypothetical protein
MSKFQKSKAPTAGAPLVTALHSGPVDVLGRGDEVEAPAEQRRLGVGQLDAGQVGNQGGPVQVPLPAPLQPPVPVCGDSPSDLPPAGARSRAAY